MTAPATTVATSAPLVLHFPTKIAPTPVKSKGGVEIPVVGLEADSLGDAASVLEDWGVEINFRAKLCQWLRADDCQHASLLSQPLVCSLENNQLDASGKQRSSLQEAIESDADNSKF